MGKAKAKLALMSEDRLPYRLSVDTAGQGTTPESDDMCACPAVTAWILLAQLPSRCLQSTIMAARRVSNGWLILQRWLALTE